MAVLAIVLPAALSCAPAVKSFTDPSGTAEFHRMSANRLSGGFFTLDLNAQCCIRQGVPSYSLMAVYRGPSFLNVEPGETLVLDVDGRRTEFFGRGSRDHRVRVFIGLVEETAFYHDVDPALFGALGEAGAVKVVLRGSSAVVSRHFGPKNFKAFKEFSLVYGPRPGHEQPRKH
jgi:hypothetical protein